MSGCRPLKREEVARLAEAVARGRHAARNRALVLLGTNTGFRISELLTLRAENVFLRGEVLRRVRVARRYMKGKRASREVVLNEAARAALTELLRALHAAGRLRPETFLFQSQARGNRPVTRRQALRVLRQGFAALGLAGALGTHSMRKAFARQLYESLRRRFDKVEAVRKVQRQLGHRDIETTMRYLGIETEDADEAVMQLNLGMEGA